MKNNVIKAIIISLSTIITGYIAVALPLNLFNFLSKEGQRLFFIIEISIYLILGSIFIVIKDRKEMQMQKQRIRQEKRKEKTRNVHENWHNIAA